MSRLFYHVMQDNGGNLLFGVSGTMRLAGSGTLATIYGDEELTVILPNPMTNHPSFGSFKCFLGAGDYDFYMAKSGYTFETLTGVQGHGTMAQQDAASVAITGGNALGMTQVQSNRMAINTAMDPGYQLAITGPVIQSGGGVRLASLGLNRAALSDVRLAILHPKATDYALLLTNDGDTGRETVMFLNTAAAPVGSINATATATTFNTSSDARLKHAITALTGALDVVQALRPVAFRWNSTDELAHGFLAHELQQVIAEAVSGLPDAVNEDGSVRPQQVDHSRLVPWLVSAVQELAARVGVLQAQVSGLEHQLGI